MVFIVTLLGVASCLVAVILFVRPTAYLAFAERALDSQLWYGGAIALRIGLGVVLMLAAPSTRYPGGVFWIGVVFVLAAIIVLFYPKQKMRRLVDFWVDRPAAVRAVSLLAFIFGAYLVYASV